MPTAAAATDRLSYLVDASSAVRQFEQWTMGFKNANGLAAADMVGHSSFLDEPLTSPVFIAEPSRAMKLPLSFKRDLR